MSTNNDLKSLDLTVGDVFAQDPRLKARNVSVFYGDNKAIDNVTIDIGNKEVISFIGPSGCGKSTFLRCFNRMNDTIDSCIVKGEITIDDENIYDKKIDVVPLRARIGMVFQKPNPFPKSIYDNVAYGPRIHGLSENKEHLDGIVEESLKGLGYGKKLVIDLIVQVLDCLVVSNKGYVLLEQLLSVQR